MMASDPVALVEAFRAEGRSIAAACRAAGISASTYYRRRRGVAVEPTAGPLVEAAPIRFARADPLLASELTDSVVHRIAGPERQRMNAYLSGEPLRLRPSLAHQGMSERMRLLLKIAITAGVLAVMGSAASAALTAMGPDQPSRLAEAAVMLLG